MTFTFAGFWEIEPGWVEEHGAALQIVDVREASEFNDPLGHIVGTRLLPLGRLESCVGEWAKDRPIATVCRSGARSAQAAASLRKAGYENLANLAGGTLRGRAQGPPAQEARD